MFETLRDECTPLHPEPLCIGLALPTIGGRFRVERHIVSLSKVCSSLFLLFIQLITHICLKSCFELLESPVFSLLVSRK